MFRVRKIATVAGMIAASLVLCGAGTAPDRGAEPARSPIPDFAPDNHTSWVPARPEGDEFISPESGPGPVTAEKGHPYVPNRAGQPTYRIADLANPLLQPWVVDKLKAANDRVRAGQVPFLPHERCWPGGVPGWEVYTRVRPVYFVQTPQEVTMIDELDHQVRHIYMNVPHSKALKPSWYGESVGHYEGDALVVDTIGLNDKPPVDNYGTPHTDKIHVVERFRLINDGKTLQATVTVDDAGAFNAPWTAVQRWRRGDARALEELACAENNFSFLNYDVVPIPEAVKADF
jgi:hypothetical protein